MRRCLSWVPPAIEHVRACTRALATLLSCRCAFCYLRCQCKNADTDARTSTKAQMPTPAAEQANYTICNRAATEHATAATNTDLLPSRPTKPAATELQRSLQQLQQILTPAAEQANYTRALHLHTQALEQASKDTNHSRYTVGTP